MLGTALTVGAYVVIRRGCPIAISIDNVDQVQITCGTIGVDAFEFVMETEALLAVVELGTDALEEIARLRSRSAG
ncbi:MAG: hypothetical protein M3422_05795 [Actinomycetota bacterium]|nr:hypothetical protein [Actinomycetota bacterium]